jgi:hypothetical protein
MGIKTRYNPGERVGLRATCKQIKLFHWRRHWDMVVPFLQDPEVQQMLNAGMVMYDNFYANYWGEERDPLWEPGDAPYMIGSKRCLAKHREVVKGDLRWYQPWDRCHFISPFVWAIGRKLYPNLHWKIIASNRHTTVVGVTATLIPRVVMDILQFRQLNAECIIAHSCGMYNAPKLCDHPREIFNNRLFMPVPE